MRRALIGVGIAGGFPHLYRVEMSLGLLDHLTLDVDPGVVSLVTVLW